MNKNPATSDACRPPLILIGGPTASGKSALALAWAKKIGGTILNADAMQVYAGAPRLTAQPSAEARASVPHDLYGFVDPAEPFSVGRWLPEVHKALTRCAEAGRVPIVVGGTGLYLKALVEGLAPIPDVPPEVRAEARALEAEGGVQALRAAMGQRGLTEEESAALPSDRQRLLRAYEVLLTTGKTLAWWKTQPPRGGVAERYDVRGFLVLPPREEVYAACDRRLVRMVEEGALDEVRELQARRLDPAVPASKILGLREFGRFVDGACSLQAALRETQLATRHYAKRQRTWFVHQELVSPIDTSPVPSQRIEHVIAGERDAEAFLIPDSCAL